MNIQRSRWRTAQLGLVVALLLIVASGLSYPGGYSFTHNFLSDLGATVAFNYQRNVAGVVLFGVSVLLGVLVLASTIIGTLRLLSATPPSRSFARFAAIAGALACVGFLGAAIAPVDRAWRVHTLSGMVAFRSFAVLAALLAFATWRDARFRTRATVGWAALAIIVIGLIVASRLGPSIDTEHGLVTQVIMQKIMVASIVVVLWFEIREAEVVSGSGVAARITTVRANHGLT